MNFIESLFSDLAEGKIKYTVLRNSGSLPASTGGSDLDIFINSDQTDRFISILKGACGRFNGSIVSNIFSGNYIKYCLMGTASQGWGLTIDLFIDRISYMDQTIIDKKFIWDNCISYNGITILKKQTDSLIILSKELLYRKTCSTRHFSSFLVNCNDLHFLRSAFPEKASLAEDIYEILNNDKAIEIKIKELSAIFNHAFPVKAASLIDNVMKLKRILKKPGYLIAFTGSDGSGKTTLINHIKPVLEEAFHDSVYIEHLRPGYFPTLSKLMRKSNNENITQPDPHHLKPSGYVNSTIRLIYYLLDYTFGYFLKVFPKRNFKSCVWIFDRYYYDFIIDPERVRIKLPPAILKFGQYIIPKPDIIFCLGTDPEVIFERKSELRLADLKNQIKKLEDFYLSQRRATWIDTGRTVKASGDDTLKVIQNFMAKRFQILNG